MQPDFQPQLLPALAARLVFYARSQRWTPNRLESYEDEMLRRLIRHSAREVPYYRELFRKIGLDALTFRGRCDMAAIPPLDKETLRTRAADFIADNAADFHPGWCKTSGSTGTPLRFLLSASSRVNDAAAILRAYQWAGFLPGMKVFTIKGHMQEWAMRYQMAGRSLDFNTVRLTRESGLRAIRELQRMKPAVFHGYPFALIMLSKIARDAGVDYHTPRTIISVGESLPAPIRAQLSQAYNGARIFDVYSMTENCALITECRCGVKHIMDDYAYHEVVDDQGQTVELGKGEILGTSYYNYAMPLIRYRTRDFGRLGKPAHCSCRRPFRAVDVIEGRKEDFMLTPDGRIVNLVEGAMNAGRGIVISQYVQDAPDHMYVNLVAGHDYDPGCLPEVERELRRRVGDAIRIDFRLVDELERRPGSSGKVPFLISRIGHTMYTKEEF